MENLLNVPIYKMKRMIEEGKLSADILKMKVLVVDYWKQYAMGVTGQTFRTTAYLKTNDEGFVSAKEARAYAKDNDIKKIRVKGDPTPYGNVGAVNQDLSVMKLSDYLNYKARNKEHELRSFDGK